MPDKKPPQKDSRWSETEALEKVTEEAPPRAIDKFLGKLKQLGNNRWLKAHLHTIEGLFYCALLLGVCAFTVWKLNWFHLRDRFSPAPPPARATAAAPRSTAPAKPPASSTDANAAQPTPPVTQSPVAQPSTTQPPVTQPHTDAAKSPPPIVAAGKQVPKPGNAVTAATPNAGQNAPQPGMGHGPAVPATGPNSAKLGPAKTPGPAAAPAPLPDDVSLWQPQDFSHARAQQDPRLLQAITTLNVRASDEDTARTLAELLTPAPTEPTSARGARTSARQRNTNVKSVLVRAVVTALGDNGTPFARNVLKEILAGNYPTDDDRTALDTALQTLVSHPDPENNALLAQILTAPESLRPPEQESAGPAVNLPAKVLQLLRSDNTRKFTELRTLVAERVVDRFAQLPPQDSAYMLLATSDPSNCPALALLYEKAPLTPETRIRLETLLTPQAVNGLAGVLDLAAIQLGARNGRPRNLGGAMPAAQDVDPQSVAQFWGPPFCTAVNAQLAKLSSLEADPQLLLLAGALPVDSVRAHLSACLHKFANDGATAIERNGMLDRVVTDPGLLALLKSMPRKDPRAAKPGRPARLPVRADPLHPSPAQKREQAEIEWFNASTKLSATWCARFRAAALAKQNAANPPAETAAAPTAPAKPETAPDAAAAPAADAPLLPADFELDRNAKVTASYRLSWPQDAPAALGPNKPSLLDVYYVYLTETSKPKRVVSFYNRQARARLADARLVNGTVWLDSLHDDKGADRLRSVDINIAAAAPIRGDIFRDDTESELAVEILIVEIHIPAEIPPEEKAGAAPTPKDAAKPDAAEK